MDLSNENVIHVKKGNVEYLQFRRLLEYKDIISHAYSLGANMNFRTVTTSKKPLEGSEEEHANTSYKLLTNFLQRLTLHESSSLHIMWSLYEISPAGFQPPHVNIRWSSVTVIMLLSVYIVIVLWIPEYITSEIGR